MLAIPATKYEKYLAGKIHAPAHLWRENAQIKTESISKLSNFNFQWTKILYQNNLKHIAFFFTFFESYGCNLLSVITPKTISYGSPRK